MYHGELPKTARPRIASGSGLRCTGLTRPRRWHHQGWGRGGSVLLFRLVPLNLVRNFVWRGSEPEARIDLGEPGQKPLVLPPLDFQLP